MAMTLDELVDHAAFLSTEHQIRMQDLHGEDDWNVDLGAKAFWFTSRSGEVTKCGVQLVGTAAPGPASWVWGWANLSGVPSEVLSAAKEAQRSGVPELRSAELPLLETRRLKASGEEMDRSPVLYDDLPYRLVLAAKALSGIYIHYSPVVSGGTQLWMLLRIPGFVLLPLDAARLVRVLGEGLQSVGLTDHRRALTAYANARRLTTSWNSSEAQVTLPDGVVTVELDELGRIGRIQSR